MRFLTSFEVRRPHRIAAAIAVVGLLACAACSVLLNRSTTECHTNADCLSLGVMPSCVNGACVNTGIDCFVGTPLTTLEYENACTTSDYWAFSDCMHLGVCVPDGGPALVDPPSPTATPTSGGDAGVPTATCASLAGAGAVYATGSSNFPTLLGNVALLLASGLGDGGTPGPPVVWQTSNSCTGVQSIYGPASGTPYMMQDPAAGSPASAYAQYYGPNGGIPCLLGDGGVPADVGESDVYPTTCPEYSSYTNVADILQTQGPVQAMAFVVPSTSSQTSISAEAAREVFGTGGNDGGTTPWINTAYYAVRNQNTGTQQMIGKAIGVPANAFWGIQYGSSTAVADFISGVSSDSTEAEQAIGILSVAVYDTDRSNPLLLAGNMQTLAFQATGQTAAYLPDSTALSYDKQNVRDGHYPIWGPIHLFYPSVPGSAASIFATFFSGDTIAEPLLNAYIKSSLIPLCAMSVERAQDVELAPLKPSSSDSCDCYFLQTLNETQAAPTPLPSDCVTCSTNAQCPSQGRSICNFGFCEEPGAH